MSPEDDFIEAKKTKLSLQGMERFVKKPVTSGAPVSVQDVLVVRFTP